MNFLELVQAEKTLDASPVWIGDSDPLRFEFTQTLSIGTATIGGLILRGKASKGSVDRDVMFQIEYSVGVRTRHHLWMVDYKPFHDHSNDPAGPEELHYLDFSSTHSHAFTDNYIEHENRMRSGNLPLARHCVPEPNSFEELLDFCAQKFNVCNMGIIPAPEWSANLFGPGA
jgi:hypothetical protein